MAVEHGEYLIAALVGIVTRQGQLSQNDTWAPVLVAERIQRTGFEPITRPAAERNGFYPLVSPPPPLRVRFERVVTDKDVAETGVSEGGFHS